jgi:hypothetical protein
MGRPGTARNSNGPGRPEIQTIRAFSGLGRAGPGGPNVHLYLYSLVPLDPLQPHRLSCRIRHGAHHPRGGRWAEIESRLRVTVVWCLRCRSEDIR